MSPHSPHGTDWKESFPRVSGDEPPIDNYVVERRVFSPRERG